ncbi:hypothetical protein [Clostridium tarantellae]|uniref:Uncharacterized protein n=1 Tax=Clostridium tarantellae TaxID=39493 RepID=A0A6I1MLU4_9CLOT|nr:hypothetical protein [Clostridium tarantellae]MPQ43087.1 hypothetical protein [Clostridium tarantellae]
MIQNNSSVENIGFVQISNMGGFVAAFKLVYTLNGKRESFETDTILIGGVRRKDIPQGATSIYVVVSVSNMSGNWVPIYNKNFNNSNAIIDLELSGTMWSPSYSVITDTVPTVALIRVVNNGAFITNFKVNYYSEGRLYDLKIPNFYLGMVRNVILPENAKDISVYVEIDAIGWGYWWKAYEEKFDNALNLTITLSGTYWYPGIDVKKEELENKSNTVELPVAGTPMNTMPTNPSQHCDCKNYSEEFFNQYISFMQIKHKEFINKYY